MTLTPNTQITQENVRLLPCPFCGGEAVVSFGLHNFHDAVARCLSCDAEGGMFDADDGNADERGRNEVAAIAAWNRRPALSPPAEGEVEPFCTFCGDPCECGWRDAEIAARTPTPASVDWTVVGRDLDALRYVLNFADEAKQVRTVMSAFTLPERETTAVRLERLYATIKALAAAQPQSNGE